MNKKYVLIISSHFDNSTDKVVDWLNFYKVKFIRLNFKDNDKIKNVNIDIPNNLFNFTINKNNKEIRIDNREIISFWYRNGGINLCWSFDNQEPFYNEFKTEIDKYINAEANILTDFIMFLLKDKNKYLGNYLKRRQNKLFNLMQANYCGLDIPETLITSQSESLKNFKTKNPKIINKPISEVLTLGNKIELYYSFVETITNKQEKYLENNFFPQLFQEQIDRKYELRIFFMYDKYFPIAIFNQTNETDWRANAVNKKFMRHVPYKLPTEIEDKLKLLMKKLNLNTGSIDMIVSKDNKYVFLEVNPVGQFAYVSKIGNYYIEKQIAEYLIKENK